LERETDKPMMKAAVLREFGKPLSLEKVPIPDVGHDELLVRVKASLISRHIVSMVKGDDLRAGPLPLIPGIETAGVVSKTGQEVQNFSEGDRVGIYALLPCGKCFSCRSGRVNVCEANYPFPPTHIGWQCNGGFAEYLRVREQNVFKIPDALDYDEAALLTSVLGVSFHALRNRVKRNDHLVIFGLGAIGMTAVQLGKLLRAHVIGIDRTETKFGLARSFGIDKTISSQNGDIVKSVKELTGGGGGDIVYQTIPDTRLNELALESVRNGGKVILIATGKEPLKINVGQFTRREIEIIGSQYFLRSDLPEMIDLVTSKKIKLKPLIVHKLTLEEINRGIALRDKEIGTPFRVLVQP
jgi:2-desacetyl-2-hydroxyethyl bacteriochlorophyllide A dehydrogenase